MPRTYDVIDADGDVLEPIDIWDKYFEPKFRERAPKIVVDTDGIAPTRSCGPPTIRTLMASSPARPR